MEEALLKVRDVTKSFGGVHAVVGVSIDVGPGSIVALVGPNGSGKTTLFSVIFGLHRADNGSVHFKNERIDHLAPHQVFSRGMVNAFQFPRLFFQLTTLDNMLLAARQHRGSGLLSSVFLRRRWQNQEKELADKALEILDLLEIAHLSLSPAYELSGGQRKLLEIGRALMADPELLLLDEPAAGVNPVLARKIFEKVEHFRQKGTSFLVIEHRLEIMMEFANWIYVMDKGRVAIEGEPTEVINSSDFFDIYVGEV
jgi:branched-chain amino acid transport system ATP-binding protein